MTVSAFGVLVRYMNIKAVKRPALGFYRLAFFRCSCNLFRSAGHFVITQRKNPFRVLCFKGNQPPLYCFSLHCFALPGISASSPVNSSVPYSAPLLCAFPLGFRRKREEVFPPFFLFTIAFFAGVKVRPATFASPVISVFHAFPRLPLQRSNQTLTLLPRQFPGLLPGLPGVQ